MRKFSRISSGIAEHYVSSKRGPLRRRHPHKGVRGLHPRSYSQLVYLGTEQQAGRRLAVERIKELILVSARTLVSSWAAAVVDNTAEAEITLANRTFGDGGARVLFGPRLEDP